jgi:general stress protein 26
MQNNQSQKLCELLKKFSTAMLITHSESGGLRARPMALVEVEDSCRLWFITSEESAKVHEIEHDRNVLIACQDGEKVHISLNGQAHLERDRARIERLWQESFKVWFPEGKTDPQIVLIAVSPVDAEYWDNSGVNGVSYIAKSAKAYLSGTTPDISEDQHGRVIMMP